MSGYVPAAKLIQLVKQETAIYDPGHCQHRDKEYLNQAWIRIAAELNSTAFLCKTKWNNLRSNYTRELRRESLKLLGEQHSTDMYPNKWPFYPMLSFLNPYLRTKALILEKGPPLPSLKNVTRLCELKEEGQSNSDDDDLQLEIDIASEAENAEQSGYRSRSPRCRNDEVPSCSWNPHQERDYSLDYTATAVNSTTSTDYAEDSDKFFLLSLLPLMKQLSPADNLGFRLEIQQILQRKLFPSYTPV